MSDNNTQVDELMNPETGLSVLNDIRLRTFVDGMAKRGFDIKTEDELMKLYSLGEHLTAAKAASEAKSGTSLSSLVDSVLEAEGAQKAASAPQDGLPEDIRAQLHQIAAQPNIYLPTLSYGAAMYQNQEGN